MELSNCWVSASCVKQLTLSSSPPVEKNLDGKFGATDLKSDEVKLTTLGSGKRSCPAGGSIDNHV